MCCEQSVDIWSLTDVISSLAGDAPRGWKTNYVLILFIGGLFFLVAFVYWQSIAKTPLMPLWMWKDRTFSLVCLPPFKR